MTLDYVPPAGFGISYEEHMLALLLVVLAAAAIVTSGVLAFRISAFRRDRTWERGYFGSLPESPVDLFNRQAYSPEGQRLFPAFLVSAILAMALFVITGLYLLSTS